MSYILDALKKAEQERALGRPPDLSTFPTSAASSRRRLWPWVLALVVVLNAAVLTFLWWSVRENFVGILPASSAPSKQAELTADLATAPAPAASQPTTIAEAEPSAPAVELPLPEPRLSESPSTPNTRAPPPETSPAPARVDAAPEAERPPVLRAMSESFRRSLPALNLDVHVYGERPEHRFVMINARRYNEGDWLNEGPLLETITADGAILRYQGQRFMLELPR